MRAVSGCFFRMSAILLVALVSRVLRDVPLTALLLEILSLRFTAGGAGTLFGSAAVGWTLAAAILFWNGREFAHDGCSL